MSDVSRAVQHTSRARGRALVSTLAAIAAALAALTAAGPAAAVKEPVVKEDFAPFADCPTESAAVCIVSNTTGGEFKLGSKDVPIPEGTDQTAGRPAARIVRRAEPDRPA